MELLDSQGDALQLVMDLLVFFLSLHDLVLYSDKNLGQRHSMVNAGWRRRFMINSRGYERLCRGINSQVHSCGVGYQTEWERTFIVFTQTNGHTLCIRNTIMLHHEVWAL